MPKDLEYEAFRVRDRRETRKMLADFRATLAKLHASPQETVTPEQRLAKFVEILMEEIDKLGTPLPVPIARVGVSGVDRQAQKLLAERGVQRVQAATFDQYRRAVRDVLDRLQSGTLAPYRWA